MKHSLRRRLYLSLNTFLKRLIARAVDYRHMGAFVEEEVAATLGGALAALIMEPPAAAAGGAGGSGANAMSMSMTFDGNLSTGSIGGLAGMEGASGGGLSKQRLFLPAGTMSDGYGRPDLMERAEKVGCWNFHEQMGWWGMQQVA